MLAIAAAGIEQRRARCGIRRHHVAEEDGGGAGLEHSIEPATYAAPGAEQEGRSLLERVPARNPEIIRGAPVGPTGKGVGDPALSRAQYVDAERAVLPDRVDDHAGRLDADQQRWG